MFAVSRRRAERQHYRFAHDQQSHRLQRRLRHVFRQAQGLSRARCWSTSIRARSSGRSRNFATGEVRRHRFRSSSSATRDAISASGRRMSLHFLFRGSDHLVKSLADQKIIDAIIAMIDETRRACTSSATGSQGVSSIYSKKGPQRRRHEGTRSAFRRPLPRTRCSRLWRPRPCTCRSQRLYVLQTGVWTPPRTAPTSISSTSITSRSGAVDHRA